MKKKCLEKCAQNCSIKYEKLATRIESFRKWNGFTYPIEMATTEFYYKGMEDAYVCFYCGIKIFQWESQDTLPKEHL